MHQTRVKVEVTGKSAPGMFIYALSTSTSKSPKQHTYQAIKALNPENVLKVCVCVCMCVCEEGVRGRRDG